MVGTHHCQAEEAYKFHARGQALITEEGKKCAHDEMNCMADLACSATPAGSS